MNTLAPSFLIGSSSFLHVTRICIKAWMSSNFGKFATELHIIIDKIYVVICKSLFFANLQQSYGP